MRALVHKHLKFIYMLHFTPEQAYNRAKMNPSDLPVSSAVNPTKI